jgi:hypothetical protein
VRDVRRDDPLERVAYHRRGLDRRALDCAHQDLERSSDATASAARTGGRKSETTNGEKETDMASKSPLGPPSKGNSLIKLLPDPVNKVGDPVTGWPFKGSRGSVLPNKGKVSK